MLLAATTLGCTPPPRDQGHDTTVSGTPAVLGLPEVHPARPGVYLTREYEVRTDVPSRLSVTLTTPAGTRRITFPEVTAHHRVPLLELPPASACTVMAEVSAEGRTTVVLPVQFTTETPPPVPEFEVRAPRPAAMEPGVTLFPVVRLDEGLGWLVALDGDGRLVHVRSVPARAMAISVLPDGGIALNEGGSVAIYEALGGTRRRWTARPVAPHDVPVEFPDLHHELLMQPDGSFFSLAARDVAVPEYPTGYDTPYDFAPATIREDLVVHVDADGATLAAFPLGDLLDVRRIGFDSLAPGASGVPDWAHANGLHYDEAADRLLVSLRHQDAVIALDRASGALAWIFAPPYGWPPELEPLLLAPTAAFVWPTHQHAPELDPSGVLRVFDNGVHGRDTPYHDSGQRGADYSRIFEVVIDDVRGTVSPAAEYVETSAGARFSRTLGNADRLPVSGNRLGTWGIEPRIVEFDPDGDVVFEVTVAESGWRAERAIRVPSLYATDVIVELEASR